MSHVSRNSFHFPRDRGTNVRTRCHLLLHGRTFLGAHPVVEEILAGETVTLFGTGAATGAKEMATFTRIRAEASALPALGRAVRLRVPLTVLRTFAPAALLAALVAFRTDALRRREIIHIKVPSPLAGDYFLPIDSLDVAEIVVVVHAHAAVEYIYGEIDQKGVRRERKEQFC